MNSILFFQFLFLFTAIRGDESPYLSAPREQEMSQPLMMGKTIIISGKNGQFNTEDPNLMQTVMNVVNNQLKSDPNNMGKDINGNDMPEVIITDANQQQAMGSPFEQKVYNLPSMTRMIASEEEPEPKKSPLWRSPLPFLHSEECPHKHHKKPKTSRKKGRKHHKPTEPTTTTPKSMIEDNENPEPLSSLLTSIISNAVFPSGAEQERQVNDLRPPSSFLMSISHRIHPQSQPMEVPLSVRPEARPHPRGFIAILHKRHEPLPLPVPQPGPQFMGPMSGPLSSLPPFNPFLALLSKLEEPMETKMSLKSKTRSEPRESSEESEQKSNYNFNVNLTVNNYNYAQPQPESIRSPFPLIFN